MRTLLPATALWLSACTATISPCCGWDHRIAIGLTGRTGTEILAVDCPDGATTVELRVRAHASGGAMHLRLFDPRGRTVFENALRTGDRDSTLRWPAQQGVHRCELRCEQFDGSYDVELAAHDAPLRIEVEVTGAAPAAGR